MKRDDTLWPGKNESTPLMVDGVLYSSTPLSEAGAVDPMTGETLWTYAPRTYDNGSPPNLGYINRGLAYRADGTDKRIFLATGDARLIALNAADGKPIDTFGDNGEVNLLKGMRREANSLYYGVNSPALVCGDTVVVGATIHDQPDVKDMPPGDVRGFDARSGVLKWDFKTIPQAGEYGNDTWGNDSWVDAGSTNVWTSMSCDETLGLVYLPLSAPNNDYFGGDHSFGKATDIGGQYLPGEAGVLIQEPLQWQKTHDGVADLAIDPRQVVDPAGFARGAGPRGRFFQGGLEQGL